MIPGRPLHIAPWRLQSACLSTISHRPSIHTCSCRILHNHKTYISEGAGLTTWLGPYHWERSRLQYQHKDLVTWFEFWLPSILILLGLVTLCSSQILPYQLRHPLKPLPCEIHSLCSSHLLPKSPDTFRDLHTDQP